MTFRKNDIEMVRICCISSVNGSPHAQCVVHVHMYMYIMGVTRKCSREGHNFQPKDFVCFSPQKSFKRAFFANFRIFRTKLRTFRTYEMKKIVDFSRAVGKIVDFSRAVGKQLKISRFFDVLD